MRDQTYSILGPAHPKEKKAWELDLKQNLSCTNYQEGSPMACPWPELFPSHFLATVSERWVWMFQMCFQTVCDCIWSCFRAFACQFTIGIQLDACQDRCPPLTSINLVLPRVQGHSILPSHPAVSGLCWRRAQAELVIKRPSCYYIRNGSLAVFWGSQMLPGTILTAAAHLLHSFKNFPWHSGSRVSQSVCSRLAWST